MKEFSYHTLSSAENICNYDRERKLIRQEIEQGRKLVLYGRRNTGKTSLIYSVTIPEFKKHHKNAFVVFADFMGCKTLAQISDRLRLAFENAFNDAFPSKQLFTQMLGFIKTLRPRLEVDPTSGNFSVALKAELDQKSQKTLEEIFKEISHLATKVKTLLVFDEFQDISLVDEAQGIFRNALQKLPAKLPVIIMGSKKHLLSQMFANAKAPFASWGLPLEIPQIEPKEYCAYINERFHTQNLKIDLETTQYLMNQVQSIPEAINMICDTIFINYKNKKVDSVIINEAIHTTLIRFRSTFLEYLSHFSKAEYEVLKAIATNQPVLMPRSKSFVSASKVSQGAVSKIFKKFEDEATIYKEDDGYVLADPLLGIFLKQF